METALNFLLTLFTEVQNYAASGLKIREAWPVTWAKHRDAIVGICQREREGTTTYTSLKQDLGLPAKGSNRQVREFIAMLVGLQLPTDPRNPVADEEVVASVLRLRSIVEDRPASADTVYTILASLYGREPKWTGTHTLLTIDNRTLVYEYKAVKYRHEFVRTVSGIVNLAARTAADAQRELESARREADALTRWEKAKAEAEKWGKPVPPKPEVKPKTTPVPNDTDVLRAAYRTLEKKLAFNYTATPQAIAMLRSLLDMVEARSAEVSNHIDSPTESVVPSMPDTTVSA